MTDQITTNVDASVQETGTLSTTASLNPTPLEVSWKDSLPEDLRGLSTLQNVNDITSLVKSYDSAQRMLGSSIRIPGVDASPEARNEFYNKIQTVPGVTRLPDPADQKATDEFYSKLGRPATPADYRLPEEIAAKADPESLNSFSTMAHKLGLTNQQAAELVRFDVERQAQMEAYANETRNEAEITLKNQWGADYNSRLQGAKEVARMYSEKYPDAMAELVSGPAGNNPALLHILSEMYSGLKESGTLTGSTGATTYGLTPEEAKNNMQDILDNKGHAYFNQGDPNHKAAVAKMSKLFEAAYPE